MTPFKFSIGRLITVGTDLMKKVRNISVCYFIIREIHLTWTTHKNLNITDKIESQSG